jgi:histone deacetylase 6
VGDSEYVYAFKTIVLPVLKEYKPELILVSCGFDSAEGDPIGGLRLTATGYQYMLQKLLEMELPLALVLEGGYNLDVLAWGSEAIVKVLEGHTLNASALEEKSK